MRGREPVTLRAFILNCGFITVFTTHLDVLHFPKLEEGSVKYAESGKDKVAINMPWKIK